MEWLIALDEAMTAINVSVVDGVAPETNDTLDSQFIWVVWRAAVC